MELVHLVTASGTFHAQVITARLGAEGFVTQTRGSTSTWPLADPVDVLVERSQFDAASTLLLADRTDEIFNPPAPPRSRPVRPWVVGAVAAVTLACSFAQRWI